MDILIVKMSALGDVIQALAVVDALKKGFPGCRLHWLVEEVAEPVVRSHPGVDRVLVSRRKQWPRHLRDPRLWPKVISEVRALVAALRQRYDLALDLQGLMKSGIWMSLTRAPRKVGIVPARERLSSLVLNELVEDPHRESHAVDRYLRLVEALGCPRTGPEPHFGIRPSQEARRRADELLISGGVPPEAPMVALVPGARWESKRWTVKGFASLGDMLAGSLGMQVLLVGSGEDSQINSMICGAMTHKALDLSGRTDIQLLMAVLERAAVVVSTDSGPMHMAAALGTPVVALFGPTAPWRTGPYGKGHKVVRKDLPCSPCFKRRCPQRKCMAAIEVREVLHEVEQVLRERTNGLTPMAPSWNDSLEALS